jgi:hypothetical protein
MNLLIVLLLISTSSFAALDPNMPRAGMYKIMSMDGSISNDFSNVKQTIDSETGDITVTYSSQGRTVTKKFAGNGSQQQCIRYNPNGSMVMPSGKGVCVGKPGVRQGNTTVSKADCEGMSMVMTMRKLQEDIYEQKTKVEMKNSASGMPAMGLPNEQMMEKMIAAQPPEKRAELRKQMAAMYSPEAKAKMNAQLKEVEAMRIQQEKEMEQELAKATSPEEKAQLQQSLNMMKSARAPGKTYQTYDSSYMLVRIGDCK